MPKKNKVKLECPRCHGEWAELSYEYNSMAKPEDVRVLDGSKKFGKEDSLVCTFCSYGYTNWDIMLAIAGANKKNDKDKEVRVPGHRHKAKE